MANLLSLLDRSRAAVNHRLAAKFPFIFNTIRSIAAAFAALPELFEQGVLSLSRMQHVWSVKTPMFYAPGLTLRRSCVVAARMPPAARSCASTATTAVIFTTRRELEAGVRMCAA